MKSLFILILYIFLFVFLISAIFSFFAFLVDVLKWHQIEKKTKIKASKESEVNSDERDNNASSDRGAYRSSNGTDAGSSDGDCDRDSGSSSDTTTDSRSIWDFGM